MSVAIVGEKKAITKIKPNYVDHTKLIRHAATVDIAFASLFFNS